jgi:hypothetical protein
MPAPLPTYLSIYYNAQWSINKGMKEKKSKILFVAPVTLTLTHVAFKI